MVCPCEKGESLMHYECGFGCPCWPDEFPELKEEQLEEEDDTSHARREMEMDNGM